MGDARSVILDLRPQILIGVCLKSQSSAEKHDEDDDDDVDGDDDGDGDDHL